MCDAVTLFTNGKLPTCKRKYESYDITFWLTIDNIKIATPVTITFYITKNTIDDSIRKYLYLYMSCTYIYLHSYDSNIPSYSMVYIPMY